MDDYAHDPRVMVLRGIMRAEIPRTDYTRAVYLAARQARLDGIPDALLRRAVDDLRAEGLIPEAVVSNG